MMARKILYFILIYLFGYQFNVQAQNPKSGGYMGLWHSFGRRYEYGYKYSGGLATFSSQHNPMAVYSPEAKKTFFVYSGTPGPDTSQLQIMISYFDHRTHKVPRPVIVYDKMGVNDPQDNATISIDNKGFIWVFISGRGRTRPGYIFRSANPYSIDAFEKKTQGEIVFPQAWWMRDSCFLMMHTKVLNGRELYWTTGTDGMNWEPAKKLAGMGGHFQVTNIFGGKLFSVFSYCPGGNIDNRTNLYIVQTGDLGKTWKTIDGKLITTPLTEVKNDALIRDYESEKKKVYINDLNFDREGNPVILAIVSNDFRPGPQTAPREWTVIYRRNGEWNFIKVCNMPHNYNLGSIYTGDDEWRIIGPSDEGPQKYGTGGEMILWTSADSGKTWKKELNITSGSRYNNSYARRPFNASDEFYSFWADGDAERRSESHIYFTNKKCDKVWVLPYKMNKDFEKPIRIK
ncbi:MAG TPA: BNR-4 repeat-containing protein [Bacteroidales bacterium]|nr:BNR-4 repeat-containing protein [Bacteroidales bacterium]